MTLGVIYHMPFWYGPDGTLREIEGSFARYIDSLAPYFDEISLCVPMLADARGGGTAIHSPNVTVTPLPAFDGPAQFYPTLPRTMNRLARWVRRIDLLHCRVPTPAAIFAFALARVARRPAFLLVVGDLRALLQTVPYRGVKRGIWRAYTELEERGLQWMVDRALTFANGAPLAAKHTRPGRPVIETTTTTIGSRDIAERADTCLRDRVRILSVSRIDPRKGLRVLPRAMRLLVDDKIDVTLDIVGPTVGRPGHIEREAIVREAVEREIADRLTFAGTIPLETLLPMYARYDIFVLPTLPGEGVPRVLLEAMSAGLPIVTTRVAGIPGLVTHESNGLLVDSPTAESVAAAVTRIVREAPLRRRLIARGYDTARRFTLENQAARMMDAVAQNLQIVLRRPVVLPAV